MNWDDLRYILAVARCGTISDGARALRVNSTTVSRRLRAMEEEANTALFKKLKHGAVLTAAGEEMVRVAEEVEQLTHALDAKIHGLDTKLTGTLRVASLGGLFEFWKHDLLAFHRLHEGITLEINLGVSVSNITQREADVAIRFARQAPEHLLGRKHAEIFFAVYGSRDLVAAIGAENSYRDYPWISWDLSFARGTDIWLEKNAPGARITMRVDNMSAMISMLEAGFGITMIPCVIGDSNPNLQRVGSYLEGGLFLWVLTHPQLRNTARVRVFLSFMRELIKRDKELIEGRRPWVPGAD